MDESLGPWLSSPCVEQRSNSLVISDREDGFTGINEDGIVAVLSSASSGNVSRSETPARMSSRKKSSLAREKVRHGIRKNISDDADNEDDSYDQDSLVSYMGNAQDYRDNSISNGVYDKHHMESSDGNDFKLVTKKGGTYSGNSVCSLLSDNESDDNSMLEEWNGSTASSNESKERIEWPSTYLSSLGTNVNDREHQEAEVAIKQESGVDNIDPLTALKRAKNTPSMQTTNAETHFVKSEDEDESDTQGSDFYYDIDNSLNKSTPSYTAKLEKQIQQTLNRQLFLTVDSLQDLHGSLVGRPSEKVKAEDPQGLKVKLMPHQKHALAWLMWREQQKTPGGVLADDMGLGKTVTMISLILVNVNKKRMHATEEESDEEWMDCTKPLRSKGGTLVVCPASVLWQWEGEIKQRCEMDMLSVQVYHGRNRGNKSKSLTHHDVVITTYSILAREFRVRSTMYKIMWERVILDEAHIVRNHKTHASEAVCGLIANKRWALSGTPIQNKEMDLYSILKFLKCSPFDDLQVWKRWVGNKHAAGHQRLTTVMNSLMLRRTKQELQIKGEMESLPEKFVEEVSVTLDSQEQLVYEKVLIYSRTLFAQFLAQRAEKKHMYQLPTGKYDRPSYLSSSSSNRNAPFTKAQNKLLSLHADVKIHEIFVLLLRLRQICVHPALIQSMLDQKYMRESRIMETENLDPNLLRRISDIMVHDTEDEEDANEQEIGVDYRVTTNLLTSQNPVFRPDRLSSKIKVVLDKVEEVLEKNDKLIIVSQWKNVLDVVARHLPSIEGATFRMFTGNVPIKERQGIVDAFNAPNKDPNILLLSLTAGGVGLNLVGGNHLILVDIHWNPQLEIQVQDRIYRFGQQKNVYIYRFICKDTIEERIKQLQEKKLELAQSVLSGDKNFATSKLTFNALKSLFAL